MYGLNWDSAAKFKVGDRVTALINDWEPDAPKGSTGVVHEVLTDRSPPDFTVKVDGGDGFAWFYRADQLAAAPAEQAQAAPKYKVGQRVRVVKDGYSDGGSHHEAEAGDVDMVSAVHDDSVTGEKWAYYFHEIAPAFLPGDLVRLTKHSGYFAIGDTGEVERQTDAAVFVKHGSYQRIGMPIDADALELIAASCPQDNTQQAMHLGEFEARLSDGFSTAIGGTPRPCIVARVLDGTPRPSNVPFVHASVQAATVEAERLAKNNPGQEFAVYQRVAGRVAEVEYSMREVA